MDRRKKLLLYFPALIILVALCLPPGPAGGLDGTAGFIGSCRFAVSLCNAVEKGESEAGTYVGFLFSQIDRVGTKSEGPEYYLRMDDGVEIHVFKKANLWQEDPALQELVNRRVSISGELTGKELFYTTVEPLDE